MINSTGVLVSTGISSEVSLGVKVSTNLSSVQSAIVADGSVLTLPDILIAFNSTNITSFTQLKAAFADMLVRAAQVAGLTS
jgi:hypothetical protein